MSIGKGTWLVLITLLLIGSLIGYLMAQQKIKAYQQTKVDRLAKNQSVIEYRQPESAPSLVLFGDSRAAQWPSDLYPVEEHVFNAGIGGDVTANMLWRLPRDVLDFNPATVVVLAGINDLVTASMITNPNLYRQTVAATTDHIEAFVKQLSDQNIQVILFTITPPLKTSFLRRLVWGNTITADVDKVNATLKNLANDKVVVIDSVATFKQSGANWQDQVRVDALHFSRSGYELLRDAVADALSNHR